MRTEVGDIWKLSTKADTVVIPTNVGWKNDGKNPMGRGLARQAARRWGFLAEMYGTFCQKHGRATPLCVLPMESKWCHHLILFPTKPLNVEKPYLSWRQDADMALIEVNLLNLQRHASTYCEKADAPLYYSESRSRRILVPSVGAGEGGIPEEMIMQLLERHLTHPSFVHVRYDAGPQGG